MPPKWSAPPLNADDFPTLHRRTKGCPSPEELREVEAQAQGHVAWSVGEAKPKQRKQRRLTRADKVKTLTNCPECYDYLSEHFGHGRAVGWKGPSWRGSVVSVDRVRHELAFLGLMNYLANQMALMNATAALRLVEGDGNQCWKDWVEPTLAH